MSNERAGRFADALQDLERGGDVDGFVSAVFAEDAELLRPETDQQERGSAGAKSFWTQYLGQFDQVSSEFSRVLEQGSLGVLEWTSTGKVSGGAPISYAGVSLLDFDADGRVTRFATYFDTAQFARIGSADE